LSSGCSSRNLALSSSGRFEISRGSNGSSLVSSLRISVLYAMIRDTKGMAIFYSISSGAWSVSSLVLIFLW